MAHELTFQGGIAQMFSVRQTPWHQEGHLLVDAPTLEQGMELAGLNFEVEVVPSYVRRETGDGDEYFVEAKTGRAVVRTDNQAELGTVGMGYHPLQNADAFRVLEPLLDSGVATLETGGSLREGADVWLLVRFDLGRFGPVAQEVLGGEVEPFGLIANNHAGRRGVLLQMTPIRVVCANTLGMAERRGGVDRTVVVRHTREVASRTVQAAMDVFHGVVKRYEVVAEQYATLKATTLEQEEFRRLVLDLVAPHPAANPRWNPEARMAKSVLERAEKRRDELTRLWTQGAGHVGDHSAWEAYNAVAEAMDHNADLWPIRGGVYRTASLLDGTLRQAKDNTLQALVRHAERKLATV